MTPKERAELTHVVTHALGLAPRPKSVLAALDEVRPVASAGSVGDAVRAIATAPTPRALRRALAELDALVTRAAHTRTKRAERANLVAQLVLLCDLSARLEIPKGADLRAIRRRLEEVMGG